MNAKSSQVSSPEAWMGSSRRPASVDGRDISEKSEAMKKEEAEEKSQQGESPKIVELEPIFFKLNDKLDKEAVNEYRLKYREFRTGKAFGARGEINKETVIASDPVDTIVPPFIAKLASMVNNCMYSEYVDWSNDGKKVVVKKVSQFSSAILPKYFKHSNFTSFLRQLNMYGFHTARQGKNWREFRNDLFTRENPKNYCKIKRRKGEEKASSGKSGESRAKKRKKNNGIEKTKEVSAMTEEVAKNKKRIFSLEQRVEQLEELLERAQSQILDLIRQGNGKKHITKNRKRKASSPNVRNSPSGDYELYPHFNEFLESDTDNASRMRRFPSSSAGQGNYQNQLNEW
eukprot:CAMPEP_0184016140 /NCGR_PEP_ID=MMETSP0954-20121128/6755_1 /TAXON_ID=627963 /ORGANISM="Aplanochytrium sp, Strain PBS07" /LENGTH=343 /DNA_ID=CAMNT_0026297111 /DNA_START=363 /DNA_END=1391 /DNA_ORIENTATION=+